MLARLSAAALRVPLSEMTLGDERFFLDTETLRLVVSVPDISWGRLAQICERAMNPMYKGLYSILEKDMEHVAHLLAALELDRELTEGPLPLLPACNALDDASSSTSSGSTPSPDPVRVVSQNTNPSVPTIIITPCPRQPRETSCQAPYQDSAFRNRLTVPSLRSFNQSFPPMLPQRRVSGRHIHHWVWKNGHWQAALKKGLEQRPRGLKHRTKNRPTGPIKSS
ncbi:hypothetical protein B0H12DRAFT_1094902 [Mycena haematopus]|nr:hypothetical protein B0H12DRAFT_1094902 [Mycena haematopus]